MINMDISFIVIFLLTVQFIPAFCMEFEITEELPNGTEIAGVSNQIKSQEINHESTYKIFGNERLSRVFRIDNKTAQLFVNGRIDRETLCPKQPFEARPNYNSGTERCMQNVQILVSSPSLSSVERISLTFLIRDINDNTPIWSEPVLTHSFIESSDSNPLSHPIPLRRASDPDAGDNGRITYSLQGQTAYNLPFKLDNQKDALMLIPTARLDREDRANYSLRLLATDHGNPRRTGSVSLHIVIEDVNDHAPIFNQTIYRLNEAISENTPVGKVLLTVFAQDKDSGDHGRVVYRMSPSETSAKYYFRVKSDGKIIVKRKLDYEKKPNEFRFRVIAEDSAPRAYQKSSSAEVAINLFDENDEAPQITANFIQKDASNHPLVMENNLARTRIAYVTVKDLDYDENDRVECRLSNSNFSMISESGKRNDYALSTSTTFDRETTPIQMLTIACKDKGNNEDSETFTIKIGDMNDQDPVFHTTFHFSIAENSPPGTTITGSVIAQDADEGINRKLEYFIDPSFAQNFSVDSTTGILTSKVRFDRELSEHYTLRVLAVDKGIPSRTGTGIVVLRIIDENDWAPEFTQHVYPFSVPEDLKVHGRVGKVIATDRDTGINKRITYQLRPEDTRMFSINQQTGLIQTKRRLDRETKAFYVMQVIARDHGSPSTSQQTATTTVSLTVLDVNDNAPIFIRPNQTASMVTIDSGDALGKQILRAEARDIDDGDNGLVSYQIKSGDPSKHFTMDGESGVLFLGQSFRGKRKITFPLVLEACDRGQPPRCVSSVTFRVVVSNQAGPENETVNPGRASNNEPIIICLAVIFAILVLATVVLIFLIKRKSFWTRKIKKPHVSQPSIPGDSNNPDDLRKRDTTALYEGETLLAKTAAHGSAVFLDELDVNAKKKQLYAARIGSTTPGLRRGSEPGGGIDLIQRPVSPDYQTLDSICGNYRTRGPHQPGQRLPQYSTGGAFLVSSACNAQELQDHLAHQHQQQQIYTPSLHTYYEINNVPGPPEQAASATLERRRCQTMGRPRPPPRAPCDYGTHVFRPIPVVNVEDGGGGNQLYDVRTLERGPSKGKYTYEAYKEASFV